MEKDHRSILAREIAHAAGKFIAEESNRTSLITVMHADVSSDSSKATVYVSVLPESEEATALDFLKRNRSEFRDYAAKHVRLKRVPFFDFAIDTGEKNRQAVQYL